MLPHSESLLGEVETLASKKSIRYAMHPNTDETTILMLCHFPQFCSRPDNSHDTALRLSCAKLCKMPGRHSAQRPDRSVSQVVDGKWGDQAGCNRDFHLGWASDRYD